MQPLQSGIKGIETAPPFVKAKGAENGTPRHEKRCQAPFYFKYFFGTTNDQPFWFC